MNKYTITLEENKNIKNYKIKEDLFLFLINKLKPFQNFSQPSKPIKCIETGEIFKNARHASNHIKNLGLSDSRSIDAAIKRVCKGQRESAFGYHWEFVLDDYKQETSLTKGKKHIVRLKQDLQTIKGRSYTSSHSTSYRLDETLFKNLKNDIEKYSADLNRQRPVKCLETGRIFFSEHSAGLWIKEQKFVNGNYVNGNNANIIIKDACNGIREKAYGYHWEFADEEKEII